MRPNPIRRAALAAAAGGLALVACGGSSDDAATDAIASGEPAVPAGDAAATEVAAPADGPAEFGVAQVDLVGETVRPESEIESNLLPPVVLDDVTTGRKVNFRNLVPQDKPILLWMYAPH